MNNRINLIAILSIVVFTHLLAQGTSPEHQAYIDQYKDVAIREMNRSGVPASIILAQALLESGAGTSLLATEANNHFGIKEGGEWYGEVYYKKDDDKNARGEIIPSSFRKYVSADQSFVDHSNFLTDPKKSRYDFLFRLEPTDYKAWARGLKKAGYATNRKYPSSLISLIERYQLYQYDQPIATAAVVETTTENPIIIIGANPPTQTPVEDNTKNRYHTVKTGETMADISEKYGISLFWLNYKNRMKEGMQPATGSQVKLNGSRVASHPDLATKEKVEQIATNDKEEFIIWSKDAPSEKAKPIVIQLPNNDKNSKEHKIEESLPYLELLTSENGNKARLTHTVQRGETLWSISRKYNMDVNDLKRKNRLMTNTISVNQVIVLR